MTKKGSSKLNVAIVHPDLGIVNFYFFFLLWYTRWLANVVCLDYTCSTLYSLYSLLSEWTPLTTTNY